MLGEVDDRLILAYTPYKKEKNGTLMLVNPKTMTVEKKLEVSENFASTDVSLTGEYIKIRLKDRVIAVGKTFAQDDSVSLPKTITEKINREPQYNDKGAPDVFFGGYDVSGDRKRYVYADEVGVKLFNTIDNSEKLLFKTVPITGSELLDNSYHKDPRFVADEQRVITTMTGYDGAEGYTLCDLERGTAKTHSITAECSSTGLIRYDTGLLEVNTHLYNQEKQIGECKANYLDFRTGDVKETTLTEPGDTGYIRMPDYCYVGQNYAAFITSQRDGNDNANNMFYLNRLNLKTFHIEHKIISVKAAEAHILGVLTDGGIVFWYLQLYELLEIGCQIFRSRVTHVIKKSELSMSKVYIIKKAEVANQIGANGCPKCGGELLTRRGRYGDIFKGVTIIRSVGLQLLTRQ
ncbi:MAG: hypothetical protein ACYDGZ_21520 [Desulfosporosinus fructosivorans]